MTALHSLEERLEPRVDVNLVREKVREYIEKKGRTQSSLAQAIGVSPATISQFLKGTYGGNSEQVAHALMQVLDIETKRQENVKTPEFVETSITADVLAVVHHAHNYRDIGVVYGEAGLGKTLALKAYVKDNPGTVHITASPDSGSSKAILEDLLEALGKDVAGDRRRLRRAIVSALKNSGRLIIIDEAQHLQMAALETLRAIYDECDIGLVLCGNEHVYTRMIGKARTADFAQLTSRVGIKRHLSCEIKKEDLGNILNQEAEVPDECLDFLHRVAQRPGRGIRVAVKLFVLACAIANAQGQPLCLEVAEQAYALTIQ